MDRFAQRSTVTAFILPSTVCMDLCTPDSASSSVLDVEMVSPMSLAEVADW